MSPSISTQEQIHELKRKISSLGWDLPNLKNKELKAIKEKEFVIAKKRLEELLSSQKLEENISPTHQFNNTRR